MKMISRSLLKFGAGVIALFAPVISHAQNEITIMPFLARINEHILNPLIALLLGVALVVFLWGIVQFIYTADSEEGREKGKKNMLWGIIGMFIMLSVYGLLNIVLYTFGVGGIS